MIKKIMLIAIATLMVLITIITAVHAEHYDSYYNPSPEYYYYGENDYYNDDFANVPVVSGPYPRYYLVHAGSNRDFLYDDFNHFDSFVGYRDLDIYNTDGTIDVLRNPAGSLGPVDPDYQMIYRTQGRYNVYGYLPNGAQYVKHYYHDHEWEMDDYDYGYGYDYFIPSEYYSTRPVYTNRCTSYC